MEQLEEKQPFDVIVIGAGAAGMIFQDFQLMPGLNALDNVLLPQTFRGWRTPRGRRREAVELLDRLGIAAPQPVTGDSATV